MARVMALDYGTKRIGIATTDPFKIIATPLTTVRSHEIFDFFKKYLKNEEVECLVIGLPLHKDGTPTFLEGHIQTFIKKFSSLYPTIKLERLNEAFTSSMAEDVIRNTIKKKKNRQDKSLVDQISACIILQEYMGFNTNI